MKIHDAGKQTRETSEQGKHQTGEMLLDLGNPASCNSVKLWVAPQEKSPFCSFPILFVLI